MKYRSWIDEDDSAIVWFHANGHNLELFNDLKHGPCYPASDEAYSRAQQGLPIDIPAPYREVVEHHLERLGWEKG